MRRWLAQEHTRIASMPLNLDFRWLSLTMMKGLPYSSVAYTAELGSIWAICEKDGCNDGPKSIGAFFSLQTKFCWLLPYTFRLWSRADSNNDASWAQFLVTYPFFKLHPKAYEAPIIQLDSNFGTSKLHLKSLFTLSSDNWYTYNKTYKSCIASV